MTTYAIQRKDDIAPYAWLTCATTTFKYEALDLLADRKRTQSSDKWRIETQC